MLVDFALQILIAPSQIDDASIEGLRHAGFTDRQILDVIAVVSLNFLTGTFNLVARI